jgi:hypothetical protein
MKLRYFLSSLFIVLSSSLYSQSIYELDYYFQVENVREDYRAFMYCNGDGTGFIRVRYFNKATNTDFLVDMDMKEDYGRDKDGNIEYNKMVFMGTDPFIIMGDTNFNYSPDLFWFKVNEQTGYFEPWGVVAVEDGKQYNGIYTNMNFIEMEDLTPDFVLQYFTKEDGFYQNLFVPKIRPGGNAPKGAMLHFISVTNTEDDQIGQTCAIDKKMTNKIFSSIATVLQIPFDAKEITGTEFNKRNVLNAINSTNPGDNDIIIFYYSGHGFSKTNDPNLFPYLDLRVNTLTQKLADEEINIEEIYRMIKAKKGRVKLVLSDCCNWGETMKNVISPNVASIRSSSLNLNPANCQALFMSPEPVSYLITAASKGEVSAGTLAQGGFFTSQFKGSLEKYMGMGFTDKFSWMDIVTGTQALTKTIAEGVSCPQPENNAIYKPCKQTPVFRRN